MAKKEKRVEKSKEDIAREFEVERKKRIVVNTFYPALVDATISVDEAKMLVRAISSLMIEEVMKTMFERKFSEISPELLSKLAPSGERKEEIEALLGTLEGENLFVAREIVEGMSNAIEQMVQDDLTSKSLKDFTPDWQKMLNA